MKHFDECIESLRKEGAVPSPNIDWKNETTNGSSSKNVSFDANRNRAANYERNDPPQYINNQIPHGDAIKKVMRPAGSLKSNLRNGHNNNTGGFSGDYGAQPMPPEAQPTYKNAVISNQASNLGHSHTSLEKPATENTGASITYG